MIGNKRVTRDEYNHRIIPVVNKLWPRFTKQWNDEVFTAVWLCIYPFYTETILDALHLHYTDPTKFKPDWNKIREHCRKVVDDHTSNRRKSPQDVYVEDWSECYRGWDMVAEESHLIDCFSRGRPPDLFYDKIQPACRELAAKTKLICKRVNEREKNAKYNRIKALIKYEVESREAFV